MSDNPFTYKSQEVNYLGFLEAQLRDLQGIDRLVYELMQNADDAKDDDGRSPSRIAFDLNDDALIVSNDGLFRAVDFDRLQSVAGGGKRAETDVTGAFGLGFTAVYQVTDAPEIFSNGRHWQIQPDAPADQRIRQQSADTEGTRFRLPWAFDPAAPTRRALRLPAIRPDQLDDFAAQMGAAIETGALFLRHLQTLTVRRNGTLVRQIERETSQRNELTLRDDRGRTAVWLLLDGDFTAAAAALRAQYEWQIEPHRRSQVRLALFSEALCIEALSSDSPVQTGRLFAVLPTDATLPLPVQINADFFPTTDRKRIHFDGGYQAEWNEAAVAGAAVTLADGLAALPAQLGPTSFWRLLQQMAETERQTAVGELPSIFAAFWQKAAPLLPNIPLVYTARGEWRRPAAARRLPAWAADEATAALLTALDIPIIHPDLRPYAAVIERPEVGCPPLTTADLAQALQTAGLNRLHPALRSAPLFSFAGGLAAVMAAAGRPAQTAGSSRGANGRPGRPQPLRPCCHRADGAGSPGSGLSRPG
jgi:hypothetical protein